MILPENYKYKKRRNRSYKIDKTIALLRTTHKIKAGDIAQHWQMQFNVDEVIV